MGRAAPRRAAATASRSSRATCSSWGRTAHAIAAALGSHEVVQLIQPNASLNHAASGRQWTGAIYLATPQLLHAFGIPASQVDPNADILSMRPGLSGLGKMQLNFAIKGSGAQSGPGGGRPAGPGGPVLPPVPDGALAWPTR